MAVADPLVMPTARELLECFAQELEKVTSPPKYVQLRAGSVVDYLLSTSADECCEGLAWVRPAAFFPSSNQATFPTQDAAPPARGDITGWAVTLEMGVVRCMPTPDQHSIVSPEQWDAVTQAVMDDAAAMRRAICCWIDAKPGRSKIVLPGTWSPLDIEGGCVGGVLPVTFRRPACDCADAGDESP